MNEKSNLSVLEKISGSMVTEAALTMVAALAGGPIAPLLPVLSNSLAAGRQRKRVESEIAAIQQALASQSARIEILSDEQYKIVNEAVLAVFQTTQEEKLRLLRNAVLNALVADVGNGREATMLSRIIRDISAEEAAFLVKASACDAIRPMETVTDEVFGDKLLRINQDGEDYLNAIGLLSLGLLAPSEATWESSGDMRFTSIAAKVVDLLREPDA